MLILQFIFPFLNLILFSKTISCETLYSSYSLYKANNQIYFTVSVDYENYALTKTIQKEAYISSLECISFFAESFKSRIILYSALNGIFKCKAYQYMPDFNSEVISTQALSKIFIRKENIGFTNTMILKGHTHGINDMVLLKNGNFVTASSHPEYILRVWNLTDGSSLKNVTGFNTVFALDNDDLICGPVNITILNGTSLTVKKRLNGLLINKAVSLKNGDIAITDGPYIWILNTTDWNNRLNISLPNIGAHITFLVALNNGDIVSSSSDSKVRIWDSKTGNIKIFFTGEYNGPVLAVLKNGDLVCGYSNSTIIIIDSNTGKTKKMFSSQQLIHSLEVLENGDLAIGGKDGIVRIFDAKSGYQKLSLNNSQEVLSFLSIKSFDNGDFAVGSNDLTIKIWKKLF